MAGASASAVNIPVLARSVGGTSSQDGAIVFRIPGIGHAYTAHVSEDATVFVQSREDVAPSLQCVAVIDAVHLQDDTYRATHGSALLAGAITLQWLGTSEFVLAVVHTGVAHLLSLRAALQNPYNGHSQHHIVARIVAPSDILSLALEPSLASVYLTTADGALACHSAPKQTQGLPGGALPPWTLSWSEETPGEHKLLCVTSHTRVGDMFVMLATASATKPSVSVWRLSANKNAASQERVPVPVPSTAVQFRPHHSADYTPKELCPPETLIAVGQDGSIRMWVDNDAASTMPKPLLDAAARNGANVGPTMCLVQVLTPPDLKPMRSPRTISQWAESPSDLPDSQTTSWLVATVYDSAPVSSMPCSADSPEGGEVPGDQVFVWGVTVLPAAARAPASTSGDDSTSSSVQAACSSPRVTASLWAFDAHKMFWENPRELHRSPGKQGMLMQQAATAATHDGSPVVALAHLAVSATGDHAEIRPSILDLVDLVDTASSLRDGSAMRAVAVHAAEPHQLATVTPNMCQVSVHPTLSLAATVSNTGTATLWSTQPMETMHDVNVRDEQITAAAWVAHGLNTDDASELATLLTCTPYRLTLQPWKAEQMEAGIDAFSLELQHESVVEIALPEYLTAAGASVHTLQVVPCGACVVVVMHASCEDEQSKVGAVVIHEVSSGAVAEGHCEVLPEAAVQDVMAADTLVAVDGAAMLMTASAGVPPRVALYDVGSGGLHLHWKDEAPASAVTSLVTKNFVDMYSAHSSLACSTAALLHGQNGSPVQLSLYKLVDSGNRVSVEPEQSIVLEGSPGCVHVTVVGLGRAAVAVACGRAVTLWFRCSGKAWAPGVRASTPGIAHTLQATPAGIIAGLASQVLLLQPSVSAAGGMVSAGGAAEACMHARAMWHPISLLMLLSRGLYDQAAGALRMLLQRIRNPEKRVVCFEFQQLLKQGTTSTQMLAMALARVVQHEFPAQPTRRATGTPFTPRQTDRFASLRPTRSSDVPQPAADPHAFSLGAFGAQSPSPAAPPQPPAADPHAFNPAAFGSFPAAPSQPQPQPTAADPMAASVLGMFGFGGAVATTPAVAVQPAPAPTPPKPPPPPAADPIASSMPDLAAFGFAGGAAAPTAPSQSPAKAGNPGSAAATRPAPPADSLSTGMIDMSAFGFGSAPTASATSTLDVTSGTTGTSPGNPQATEASTHSSPISNAAQSQDPAQSSSGGAGPVGEGRETRDRDISKILNPLYGTKPTEAATDLASSSFYDAASSTFSREALSRPLDATCMRAPSFDASCMRAPSFDMTEQDPLQADVIADSASKTRGRVHPGRSVCEAVEPESALPAGGSTTTTPALDILAVAAGQDPVASLLQELDSVEVHATSEACRLTPEEVKELRTALLVGDMLKGGVDAAQRTRERLQLTCAHAHLVVHLATMVSSHRNEASGLDVAGRRALSAATTSAAMLEAAWDEKQESEGGNDAPMDMNRGRAKKAKMSSGASALLERLKTGGGGGAGSSASGPMVRRSATVSGAGGGGSFFGASGALSGVLSGMGGGISSISGQLLHDEGQPGGATETQMVHAAAVAACTSAWSGMHVAPLLRHTVLHWAFDCRSPKGLLDAMMNRMPANERSGMEAYASSSMFASASVRSTSPWSWVNFRRIGAALWLQNPQDVKVAVDHITKATYAATKDAQSVALWYVAQGKKTLLSSMIRTGRGSTQVADFLLRDFTQLNHQAAAAKNAHQLVTQHRYSMAAAFFLLSGDIGAAMSTCIDKLHDVQMAVMLARVIDAFAKFPAPIGNITHSDVLFEKLLKQVSRSTCPVLHDLLRRAAGKSFTLQQYTAAASAGSCSCMEAHCSLHESEGSHQDEAGSAGSAPRLVVGAALSMQASDWLTRAVLCNTSTQDNHASQAPEVAAMSGRDAVEVVGWSCGHASLLCEHSGLPIPALELALRRAAAAYTLQQVPSPEGATLVAVDVVRVSTSGSSSSPRTASEIDRELLLQQTVSMLHCQSALALVGVNSVSWGIVQEPEEKPAPAARAGAASSRKLSTLSMARRTVGQPHLPVPELLFIDGVQLMSAVRGLQGHAAAARHSFEDQQSAQLLSDMSGGDAVGPLQAGGVLPPNDQLGGILHNANTLLSVHVEEVPIPPQPAHPLDASTGAHREHVGGADGDGAVVEQGLAFAVATVSDKDAQAVSCCVSSLLPLECHLQTVVATKKQGLLFCSTTGSTFCTGVRSCRYTDLHEKIVERWAGSPGMPSGTPKKGMCNPMALAQHAHRVQIVHPRAESCVAQALASHPHQATVLSGSAPGYVHAWRYSDGTLKATYAPLPLSHQLVEAGSGSVPQPSQVLHWSYPMSIAYCDSGARFAAIGKGGWVALWRHDAQWANTAHGRVGCCDWTHQCIGKRGGAVAFVGSRSTLLMAVGANTDHQDITVWDITVPLSSSRVGVIQTGHHVVDAKVSSDGVTTITVDRHGDVCGYDMRMLQATISPHVAPGTSRALLWKHEKVHAHGATCVSICPHRLKILDGSQTLAATGGRDGKVCLWSLQTGTQVQTLTKLHSTANRGLFAFSHSEERVASKVKGIEFDAVGLVSVGHDETISCVPWSSHP